MKRYELPALMYFLIVQTQALTDSDVPLSRPL